MLCYTACYAYYATRGGVAPYAVAHRAATRVVRAAQVGASRMFVSPGCAVARRAGVGATRTGLHLRAHVIQSHAAHRPRQLAVERHVARGEHGPSVHPP